jgi:hypothetical protein
MTIDMMNLEEQSTSQPEKRVNSEAIKALNRANGNGELVLSLLHYETLKRARKRLVSKEPICFIKSENPLILAHYKKILIDYISTKKDRSVVYYKGGSVDAMLSVINTSMESYSTDKVFSQKNNILARDKLILVIEREEDLIDDEWALLDLFKSDLRFGPMGIIASTSSSVRDVDIDRVPREFLFEFEELNREEFEVLDQVEIPQRFSHGYEYIQIRNEGSNDIESKEDESDRLGQQEILSSGSVRSRLVSAMTDGELSALVFLILLAFEIAYFFGRSGILG